MSKPKLRKYIVDGTFVFGKHIGVFEAKSAEEAEKMANKSARRGVSVCHQCAKVIGGDIELDEMHVEPADDTDEIDNGGSDE